MIEEQNNIKRVTTISGRYYEKDNIKYPSVTWITSYYPKGEGFYNWLMKVGERSIETRDKAGTKGTNVHNIIEEWLKHKITIDLDTTEGKYLNQFVQWYNTLKNPKIIDMEKFVINKDDKYAGTIDLIIEIDGELWIIDYKTSKSLHTSHELQVSAYKHSGYNAKLGLLHLTESSYELTEVDDKYDLFLCVKKIFDYENMNN